MPPPEPRPDEEAERADVRSRWPDEGRDFTPWLAEHLDLLGEELGMRLELVRQEQPVGELFLDILARDADADVLVAIENQLEWADDGHLGRLLAYATGCDARAAVWVATGFRREYATALHRLNEWTRDGIRFHAVMIELVREADGPEFRPRFRKVVYPGGWDEALTPAGPPMSPDTQRHRDFFEPLIAELMRSGFANRTVQYFDHTGRFFPSSLERGIGYAVSFWKNSACVTLHIRTDDRALTKRIFDELQASQAEIEAGIAADPAPEWRWRRHDAFTFSNINIRRDGFIHDAPEQLEQTRAWMLDMLPRLRDAFDPRLARIVRGLAETDGA